MLVRGLLIIAAAFVVSLALTLAFLAGAARAAWEFDEATDVEEND